MKLTPFEVKQHFTRHSGGLVTYVGDELGQNGRRLIIHFTVNGTDIRASAYCELHNGTSWAMRDATRRCAKQAFDFAYRSTGKREADMKNLLDGKTV